MSGSGVTPQAPYSTFWSESEMPRSDVILGKNGSPYQKRFSAIVKHNMLPVGNYIFAAIATVDSTWEHKRPTSSPSIDPVSHIVRARTKPKLLCSERRCQNTWWHQMVFGSKMLQNYA